MLADHEPEPSGGNYRAADDTTTAEKLILTPRPGYFYAAEEVNKTREHTGWASVITRGFHRSQGHHEVPRLFLLSESSFLPVFVSLITKQ